MIDILIITFIIQSTAFLLDYFCPIPGYEYTLSKLAFGINIFIIFLIILWKL